MGFALFPCVCTPTGLQVAVTPAPAFGFCGITLAAGTLCVGANLDDAKPGDGLFWIVGPLEKGAIGEEDSTCLGLPVTAFLTFEGPAAATLFTGSAFDADIILDGPGKDTAEAAFTASAFGADIVRDGRGKKATGAVLKGSAFDADITPNGRGKMAAEAVLTGTTFGADDIPDGRGKEAAEAAFTRSAFSADDIPDGRGKDVAEGEAFFTGSAFSADDIADGRGKEAAAGEAFITGSTFGTDAVVARPDIQAAAATELAVTISADLEVEFAVVFFAGTRDFVVGIDVATRGVA